MVKRTLAITIGLCIAASATPQPPGEWLTFHRDYARSGRSAVDFPTCAFDTDWVFDLGEHTWRYKKGTSVWSASPIIAELQGQWLAIIGAYDHNLYALDATNGEEVWRFTAGGQLGAAPSLARVTGTAIVFVGSSDRTFYAVAATTGRKIWSYETLPWSYTANPAHPTSPVVAEIDRRQVVFVAFFNSDERPVRHIQRGELFAFRARDGRLLWRRMLTDHPLSSPAYLKVDGKPHLFVGSEDGAIYAVRATDGAIAWKRLLTHAVAATPAATTIAGQPVVIAGDRWGMVSCLSARTGRPIWTHKTGHATLSTPALGPAGSGLGVFIGSSDRCIHAIDAKSSRQAWRFPTGKYVTASPVVCKVIGKPAVICNSLDNSLYVLDAETGAKIWQFPAGEMLWAYETRGSTTWSSPAVANVDGTPLILYPAYDGKLYALKSVPRCQPGESAPAVYAGASATHHPPPVWILVLGISLLALAVAAMAVVAISGGDNSG